MRQTPGSLETVDVSRIQKRLVHLCAQAVEMAFVDGKFPLSTQPPTALANDTQAEQSNWAAAKTRNQAAEELRSELLRRFMARSTGFIAGTKHSENQNIPGVGSAGTSNDAVAIQAASQMCTAYFLKASSDVMDKMARQVFKHLACYYDAAAVCHWNIMEVHLSCDGLVVSAPFALLPQLKKPADVTMSECMDLVEAPAAPLHELPAHDAKKLQMIPKEKAASRMKILGLNQSMKFLLHLQLLDTQPLVKLRPAKDQELRHYHVDNSGTPRAFLWNKVTKQTVWQSSQSAGIKDIVRLSCLCDEGETAGAMALMDNGLAIMAHRDSQHKWHNGAKLAAAEHPQIEAAISGSLLILTYETAPWHSGLFGRRLKDLYKYVSEMQLPNVILDICMPGIIADLELSGDTTQETVKAILVEFAESQGRSLHVSMGGEHKSGRWGAFVDGFSKLKRVWHIRLFMLLLACALEGTSPWAAIAGAFATESIQILPRVLRVSWLDIL